MNNRWNRRKHPQYVTHGQLSQALEPVNKRAASLAAEVARQGTEIEALNEKVLLIEEALVVLAEQVAILETLIS